MQDGIAGLIQSCRHLSCIGMFSRIQKNTKKLHTDIQQHAHFQFPVLVGKCNMEKLTQQQLGHLKDLLNQRDQALRDDIRREVNLQDDYAQLASDIPDPGDSSFANLSVDLGNAAVNRDIAELRAIQTARLRMENGTYGECIDCGFDIPYERLQAQPMAERCAPCQDMYEKTHADAMKGSTL
ncbi:MAG: TraR/DksA family transcriptional regulator [Herminiimonas sp.]|nr:TraR/DksA family transcriptional regulator [Herminiimonas sp.]